MNFVFKFEQRGRKKQLCWQMFHFCAIFDCVCVKNTLQKSQWFVLYSRVDRIDPNVVNLSCDAQVEAGSDAPSESKQDQRVTLPAENGLSHTPIITPKPPSLVGHQPQSAGTVSITSLQLPSSHFLKMSFLKNS